MIEAAAIRVMWILHALRPKKTPGLCPPSCRNSHTYHWPCRARVSKRQYNKPIGKIISIKEDETGLIIKGRLN